MTSRGFLSDISMQFLTRSQVLSQVRKTVHAKRNGLILKELLHAVFV